MDYPADQRTKTSFRSPGSRFRSSNPVPGRTGSGISGRAVSHDTRGSDPGMSLLFPGIVIITALLYFFVTPDIARNRHLALRAFLAIAAGVGSFILLYFIQLPFTGFNMLLWLSINAATALCLNSALTNNLRGLHISAFALGLIIFLWIFGITVLSAMTATQLAAAPNVTVVSGPSDIINSSHIRLVSYETAQWRSDKVIGSLGYKSEITEPDIQTLNGTLVWITPLDYSGFLIKAWSYANEGTGGYVIVNAEDPKAEAQLVPVNHMIYTRYALLGNEVNRRVWEQHPEYLQMETTFQLDDRMQPKYVINLAEPMLYGCIGERPVGIATIDPVTGYVEFYRIGEQPAWIQRVWSETTTEDWIGWWGRYQLGWWNSILEQRDVKVLSGIDGPDVFLVNGRDGNLYWFGTVSNPGTDTSMVGYMLTNVRTGKFTFHETPGYYNDLGAAQNVHQNPEVAKAPDLDVVQPIMYVIDNQEVWIIPVITPSGEQTLVGLVEARSGTTYIGPSLQNVLLQWRGTTGGQDTGSGTDSGLSLKDKIAQIRKLLDEIEAESGAGETSAIDQF